MCSECGGPLYDAEHPSKPNTYFCNNAKCEANPGKPVPAEWLPRPLTATQAARMVRIS